MGNLVGIDLGTTFSALAFLNQIGRPEIVKNAQGESITRSAVYFDTDTSRVVRVGTEANNSRKQNVSRSVKWIKREMGNPDYSLDIDGKKWSPPEISALILKKLRTDCAQLIGEISDAVITVPAYFDDARRKDTMDAGIIAGLNVLAIINEPTAAALFYALSHEVSGNIMVYDLGGGTFDVTILEVLGKNIKVICSTGNHKLGGVDFDNKLVDAFDRAYQGKFGTSLFTCPEDRADYEDLAESLKHTLSTMNKGTVTLKGPVGRLPFTITVSEFEELISTHIATTEMLVESALDEARFKPKDIKQVLLVGGSTRMPVVRSRLQKMFGFPPSLSVNVDEAVALGAAVHAGMKKLQQTPNSVAPGIAGGLGGVKLTDVCNYSYGTISLSQDALDGREKLKNCIILKKNSALPVSVTQTFYTAREGQEQVNVTVTEGEGEEPEDVHVSHRQIFKLPPGRPAHQPIEVTYSYDTNQRMHCSFLDVESGRTLDLDFSIKGEKNIQVLDVKQASKEMKAFSVE